MVNEGYLRWTGIWAGSSLGLYYIAGIKGLTWRSPLWWGGLAAGYLWEYVQSPSKKPSSFETMTMGEVAEKYSQRNFGGL